MQTRPTSLGRAETKKEDEVHAMAKMVRTRLLKFIVVSLRILLVSIRKRSRTKG